MEKTQESNNQGNILKGIHPTKIFLPMLLGLLVVFYMLYKEVRISNLQIAAINFKTVSGDWFSLENSTNKDTIFCEITDTVAAKQENLKMQLKYIVKISKSKTQMFTDTVELAKGTEYQAYTQIFKKNSLIEAKRLGKNKCVFIFNKPTENLFSIFDFTWKTVLWFLFALSMMAIRDFGYMLRIRIFTDGKLSWTRCFNLIMLWEFTSAITPSAVGGSAVAIYFVNKEGLSVGRSTAVVMSTIFLDEVYFILMVPILFLVVGGASLFLVGSHANTASLSFTNEFFMFAIIGYTVIVVFTAFLGYGLFINPKGVKTLLDKIFNWKFLKRWKNGAMRTADDLVLTSQEFVNRPFSFWAKAFFATFFSWTGRYWIVNILILGLISTLGLTGEKLDHFLMFARQLVMWIMMLVSPTPGGSGFSEYVFSRYLGEFIPLGFAAVMALLWRLISYYPYLIMGAIIFPKWIKKHVLETTKPIE